MPTKTTSKTRSTAKKPARTAAGRAPKTTTKKAAPSRPSPAARRRPVATAAPPAARLPRRAIFIDVENTSSEESLMEVIASLNIDRTAQSVDLTAVGNWRAIGQRMARQLAELGAQLVHSAPALGVRDWSDLWIAVAAGCWLGQSSPGDILEIVSNDRAFDAVGDAAAARGVIYHRLLHRRGAVVPAAAGEAKPAASHRTRGGRRRRRAPAGTVPPVVAAAAHPPVARGVPQISIEPHGATGEQMLAVIGRLMGGDPGKWVNLDILEKALKTEGFSRPPGSPRLVTRLRALKEVEIDSHGRVRLVSGAAPPPVAAAHGAHAAKSPAATDTEAEPGAEPAGDDRPRTAKRRRRRRPSPSVPAAAEPAASEE